MTNLDTWTLVLDQGGHASRAFVFDGAGRELASSRIEITTDYPAPGQVEHDAESIIASLVECLCRLETQLSPTEQRRIRAAALCTQRSSVVCWSRNTGVALSPVLSWQDVRAADLLGELALDNGRVHQITGLRVSPHYGASKLRWALDNIPAVANAEQDDLCVGPLASFLVYRLCRGLSRERVFAIDPCNASRTLLWDIRSRDWSPELLAAFGISRTVLPQCQPNRAYWGKLALGETLIPLTVVTGDQSAVPFAFETDQPGTVFLTLGTGAFLQVPEDRQTICEGLLNSVMLEEEDSLQFALEATINGAGAALEWLAREHDFDQPDLLRQLPVWLDRVDDPPVFINAVGGLAAPYWRPAVESTFVEAGGDIAAKAVAVIESIAFLVKINIDTMQRCDKTLARIVTIGGLARLDGLLARIAALCELPVLRAVLLEATAYGGARLANPGMPSVDIGVRFEPARYGKTDALRRRFRHWQVCVATKL